MTSIAVLYLLANGSTKETHDLPWLDLDQEARAVQKAVAHTRKAITIHTEWATTADRIITAVNRYRPQVLHFSGHATTRGLVLGAAPNGETSPAVLDFRLLARILCATTWPPDVVVLNACQSAVAFRHLFCAVPVVIGMRDSVFDRPARYFAAGLYGALAAGQPVHYAVEQGRLRMEWGGYPDDAAWPIVQGRSGINLRTYTCMPRNHTEKD